MNRCRSLSKEYACNEEEPSFPYPSMDACQADHSTEPEMCVYEGARWSDIMDRCTELSPREYLCSDGNPHPYPSMDACQADHPTPTCGNGRLDDGEECDGTLFVGSSSCTLDGYPFKLLCSATTCKVTNRNNCDTEPPQTDFCTSAQEAACEDMERWTGSTDCVGGDIVRDWTIYYCDEANDRCDWEPEYDRTYQDCQNRGCNSNTNVCNDPEMCVYEGARWSDIMDRCTELSPREYLCSEGNPHPYPSMDACQADHPSDTGCTSSNSNAVNCNTCNQCTTNGHYWDFDYSGCSSSSYGLIDFATSPSGCYTGDGSCIDGNDCSSGQICVSSSASRGGTGDCISGSSLSSYDGMRCSDNSYSFDSGSSGVVTKENFRASSSYVCAKGLVVINDAGDYFASCENGGSSAAQGVWPGDECDNDVNPGFSANGVCLSGTSSTTSCDTSEVCREGGPSSNHRFDCSSNSCGDGDSCDNRGGRDGWNGLCLRNDCVAISNTFQCVRDNNCDTGETCELVGDARICVDSNPNDCLSCTQLGYAGGIHTCISPTVTNVDNCVGCIDEDVCTGTEVCVGNECRATGEIFCGNGWCRESETESNCPEDCPECVVDADCDLQEYGICDNGLCNYGDPVECYMVLNGVCTHTDDPMCASSSNLVYDTLQQCQAAIDNPGCGNGVCSESETSCPEDCVNGYGNNEASSLPELPELPSIPGIPGSNPVCGDGTCIGSETSSNCPQDCGSPSCGDGTCNTIETSCAIDCSDETPNLPNIPELPGVPGVTRCGDGSCNGVETRSSCPSDCGESTFCGDGYCNNGESCYTCPEDCTNCNPETRCGDGNCDYDESCSTCEIDCNTCSTLPELPDLPDVPGTPSTGARCGDGTCDRNSGETCSSCRTDCGACSTSTYCGDGTCNGVETCSSCAIDCDACGTLPQPPSPPSAPNAPGSDPICGDGTCDRNSGETCSSCTTDCGNCPGTSCGDGTCDSDESCADCAIDCGTCDNPNPPTPPTPPTPPGAGDSCGDGTCNDGETATSCPRDCEDDDDGNPGTCYVSNNGYCIYVTSVNVCARDNAYPTFQDCKVSQEPCGNGILEPWESCDGTFFNDSMECSSLGFAPGPLACNDDCEMDASGCSLECYDGDDGVNISEKGRVAFNGNEYYDSCTSEGLLLENFCVSVVTIDGNQIETEVFGKAEKAFFCPKGTECSEGACKDKSDIPWIPQCVEEIDCTEADETCIDGSCIKITDITEENYCEDNICFFDVSFNNGVDFAYGNAEYFITYLNSSNSGVFLKIAEVRDRSGDGDGAKIETKELFLSNSVQHLMGLAIEVLDVSYSSVKIKVLQFSCLNNELCLGNFECGSSNVCVAPGSNCIIDANCGQAESCEAGVCVDDFVNLAQGKNYLEFTALGQFATQSIAGICRLGLNENSYCTFGGKTYQVQRKTGCKFVLSSDEISQEEFILEALETKELGNGVSVRRDINRCGSQYLSLRFEGGSALEKVAPTQTRELDSLFCASGCFEDNKCYPMGYRKSGEYCGENNVFLEQKNPEDKESLSCTNNFECSSNLCLDGECVSQGFLKGVTDFLRNLVS